MFKNTCLFLVILFSISSPEIFSQVNTGNSTDHEILQKYWYYRWRLRNDFLYMGDQPGESLPISDRYNYSEEDSKFGVGDVTQLLGYYISTLATEHKLLSETNRWQDLPMTRTELYYAFMAFERLDYNAERYYPYQGEDISVTDKNGVTFTKPKIYYNTYPRIKDGFFIREDFSIDFFGDPFTYDPNYIEPYGTYAGVSFPQLTGPCSDGGRQYLPSTNAHFNHLNFNLTTQNRFGASQFPISKTLLTDAMFRHRMEYNPYNKYDLNSNPPKERCGDNAFEGDAIAGSDWDSEKHIEFNTIDQVTTLLQAFLLTKVSMPNYSIPVKLKDGSEIMVNFVQLAKDNVSRIINHMKTSGWRFEQPDGTNVDYFKGGAANVYSFPYAQIGNMIHDNNLVLPYYNFPAGFHDGYTINAGRFLWQSEALIPPGELTPNRWNTHSDILNLGSTSLSWVPPGASIPVLNGVLYAARRPYSKGRVLNVSSHYAWDDFHSMMLGYLHGFDMNTQQIENETTYKAPQFGMNVNSSTNYVAFTKMDLARAPCEGPSNFRNLGEPGVLGWNTSKRWHSAYYVQANIADAPNGDQLIDENGFISAYFSGLDFMMLHNLYYLNSNAQLPQYVNYIYRHYSENLSNNLAGNNPLTIAGYVSLTANNNIGSAMNVTYNASEEIHLTSGFHASSGAVFHASVTPVLCGLDFRSMETPDSNRTSYGISEYTQRHIYANVSDKFEHLYQLPDSISMESLEERMRLIESGINPDDPNYLASLKYDIVITPIPSKDVVTITLNGQATPNLKYSIVNSLGKEVQNGVINYTEKIDVSGWSAGLYLFKVNDAVSTVTKKFLVE